MEVLVGPTFTIDVSSSSSSSSSPPPPSYPRDHRPVPDSDDHTVPSCLLGRPASLDADSSESSSSIGTPDDSDNDLLFNKDGDAQEDGEEVQSKFHGLASLDALEDSLPVKRGLSGHFDGKSKSFSDLSQITTVKDLKKQENPFNKRRRLLIASKLSRKSAFYSWSNPKSMPLLPVDEDEDDDGYEEEKVGQVPSPSSSSPRENKQENPVQLRQSRVPESYAARMRLRLGSMKARSFSLADLQEHDEEEEEDDDEDNEGYDQF
ncbi:uncharacterized protein LOC114737488 [Neltuma alba]|uniref:uncharacterized protein LOC114737488 n=1 Tax=Neltuma alba TaxID=207710 RepID=UPI0010A4E3EA|nr:uncharacterized protein LOC114737488 [Prosopis alba]